MLKLLNGLVSCYVFLSWNGLSVLRWWVGGIVSCCRLSCCLMFFGCGVLCRYDSGVSVRISVRGDRWCEIGCIGVCLVYWVGE